MGESKCHPCFSPSSPSHPGPSGHAALPSSNHVDTSTPVQRLSAQNPKQGRQPVGNRESMGPSQTLSALVQGWSNGRTICPDLNRWLSGKESPAMIEDMASIPGSGRSPGGENGNPLQFSCLENPMDRGAYSPWGCKESGYD